LHVVGDVPQECSVCPTASTGSGGGAGHWYRTVRCPCPRTPTPTPTPTACTPPTCAICHERKKGSASPRGSQVRRDDNAHGGCLIQNRPRCRRLGGWHSRCGRIKQTRNHLISEWPSRDRHALRRAGHRGTQAHRHTGTQAHRATLGDAGRVHSVASSDNEKAE
jgi:hypothetical protein